MRQKIVMIHGMWGTGDYWQKYRRFFEEKGYECHTPTLRYHDMEPMGQPDPRLGITSLRDYAEDLEALIRGLSDTPILMGHSMGGLLAQILAGRGLAEKLVLLTSAPPAGINALKYSTLKSFREQLMTWEFWRKAHRLSFDLAVYSMLHLLPPEEQKAVYSRLVYESGRAAAEIGFWLFDFKGAAKVDANKVTCPVLVVSGAEDRITPASVSKKIAQKYRDVATYHKFERHAHWVVGEPGWEDVATFVYEWLKREID